MNAATVILAATWGFVCVLLIIQPWFARRNVLFGVVFGSAAIWEDGRARELRGRYLLVMTAGTAVVSLAFLAFCSYEAIGADRAMAPYLTGLAVVLVYGMIVFAVYHARARALKADLGPNPELVPDKISVETSVPESQTVISAAWLLLLLPLLLVSYGIAVFGYSSMPPELPTHYSFTAVDAWTVKSWAAVLSPLFTETALAVLLSACCLFTRRAPASVRGNPEAAPQAFRFRKYVIVLMILLTILMEASFLLVEAGFLVCVPPLLFEVPAVLDMAVTAAIFILYFRFVRIKKPKGRILDDDAKWALGMIYHNPSDPSTFVEKRTGIGYTLNFAKPAAWIFILGIVAVVVLSLVFSAGT